MKSCHMGHKDILKVLIVLCDLSMSGHKPGTHNALCLPFEIFAPEDFDWVGLCVNAIFLFPL